MTQLPTGTVTLLMTDIEGSTRLWELAPDAMRGALIRHDAIVTSIVDAHRGTVVRSRGEGDSFFGIFARASDAVAAAAAIQLALATEPWPTPLPLRVRIGVHTGEAELREGDYYGSEVNRCARMRALAHGGQVLISEVTTNLVRRSLPANAVLHPLGTHRLKDIQQPEHVFELLLNAKAPGRGPLALLRGLSLAPHLKGAMVAGGLLVALIFAIVIVSGSSTNQDAVRVEPQKPAANPSLGAGPQPSPIYGRFTKLQNDAVHREGIRLRLATPEEIVQEGQAIPLVIHLENPLTETRRITFPENLVVDLYVRSLKGPDAGREVYRWSEGRGVAVKPTPMEWNPGQDRTFSFLWAPPPRTVASDQIRAEYRIVAVMRTDDPIEAWIDLQVGPP
jgi:class 3 adenylate cyclase